MQKIKDHIITGILIGIVMPAIAFVIYAKINSPSAGIIEVWKEVLHLKIVGTILSFCTFANLVPFFFFIWAGGDKSARGVLIVTILLFFVVLVFKLSQ